MPLSKNTPELDEVLMMTPLPWRFMCGSAALAATKWARTLMA
jgi:hypothetical protein